MDKNCYRHCAELRAENKLLRAAARSLNAARIAWYHARPIAKQVDNLSATEVMRWKLLLADAKVKNEHSLSALKQVSLDVDQDSELSPSACWPVKDCEACAKDFVNVGSELTRVQKQFASYRAGVNSVTESKK